jgi:hypothetical protein
MSEQRLAGRGRHEMMVTTAVVGIALGGQGDQYDVRVSVGPGPDREL